MPPVPEAAGSFGCDLPSTGGRPRHVVHLAADLVDDGVMSYCCFSVERPLPSSRTISCCGSRVFALFGLGIGVMNSARVGFRGFAA